MDKILKIMLALIVFVYRKGVSMAKIYEPLKEQKEACAVFLGRSYKKPPKGSVTFIGSEKLMEKLFTFCAKKIAGQYEKWLDSSLAE